MTQKRTKQIISLMGLIVLLTTILLAGCDSSAQVGIFMNRSDRLQNEIWTFTAGSANGHITRNINMTNENLAAFHVDSRGINSGETSLIITQGDTTKTIDLTNGFNEHIDMQEFSPGRIRLRLQFDSARNVNMVISWRAAE